MTAIPSGDPIFNLKGFDSVHDPTLSNDILDSLVEWLDWGLLQKENYFNITLGEINSKGQDLSQLQVSNKRGITGGKAWEGRPNWVWQKFSATNPPISVSGIYVNDTFYPSDTVGTYAHYIDYYNGRVVFNTAIATTSKVQVEHSPKWIHVEYANSFNGMQQIEGETNTLPPELVAHLPAIAVEVVALPKKTGYQLGGGQWVETTVLFHCLAQNEIVRNRLIDIVSNQNDKSIYIFDNKRLSENEEFPLDYRGTPVSGAMNFPDIVNKYPKTKVRLSKLAVNEMIIKKTPLFGGVVKMSVESIKLDI